MYFVHHCRVQQILWRNELLNLYNPSFTLPYPYLKTLAQPPSPTLTPPPQPISPYSTSILPSSPHPIQLQTPSPTTIMVCRNTKWHPRTDCVDSDELLVRQFRKVRKLNSDLFSINGTIPPAQSSIQTLNQKTSQFLTLPPEIRSRIYHYVFGAQQIWIGQDSDYTSRGKYIERAPDNVYISAGHRAGQIYHFNNADASGRGIDLRVLRTCRQVFTEAALLPYKLNRFTFESEGVRRAFESIVRPGKKLAQRRAVGKSEVMSRRRFLREVLGWRGGFNGGV